MNSKILYITLSILFLTIVAAKGLCLESSDIIKLKKAGITEETIQLIVKEKIIETCAFTVQEILDLRNAGLSEKTIRMVIEEGSFMKDAGVVVYGRDIRSIKFATIHDIIELKDAGVSEETIRAIIEYGSKDEDDVEREKAWDMLKNMGIIVDMRQ